MLRKSKKYTVNFVPKQHVFIEFRKGGALGAEAVFIICQQPPNPAASLLIKVTLDHSGNLHIYVEDIGQEHLNHGVLVCLEVLFDDGHGFFGVVSLLLLKSLLDLILLGLHFLAEDFFLGEFVLIDFFLGQFLY